MQRIFHHPWCLTSISWYNYRKASEDCGWAPDSKKKKKKNLVLHVGWKNSVVKQQPEVLKRDFTELLDTISCLSETLLVLVYGYF